MAGLWCRRGGRKTWAAFWPAIRRVVVSFSLVVMPGCTELAQPGQAAVPPPQPPYVSIAANYLLSALKDRIFYTGFEISAARWVDSIKGWAWLACVHFQDRGHLRTYALFIQDDAVIDARYAVETDNCAAQAYTQFDLVSGELGRPTGAVQPPLY